MNKENFIKLLLSILMGSIGGGIAHHFMPASSFVVLAGWDCFALTYVVISIVVFSRVPQKKIAERCAQEDLKSWLLFLIVVVVCSVCLGVVLSFFESRKEWNIAPWISSVVGIGAIVFSWMVLHLSFTFRYAHLFYGDQNRQFAKHANGLTFPDDDKPDYFDFAYFSFVIGMTFQVSDVVITGKGVRRLVLLHSIIAFVFNTVIIAMTISELVSMG
ncbi:MAG: DUF1345 domain-containing protein [Bacteroidota bacterium]